VFAFVNGTENVDVPAPPLLLKMPNASLTNEAPPKFDQVTSPFTLNVPLFVKDTDAC
jgi:hypothetical protein